MDQRLKVPKTLHDVMSLGLQPYPQVRWLDPPGAHPTHLRNGGGPGAPRGVYTSTLTARVVNVVGSGLFLGGSTSSRVGSTVCRHMACPFESCVGTEGHMIRALRLTCPSRFGVGFTQSLQSCVCSRTIVQTHLCRVACCLRLDVKRCGDWGSCHLRGPGLG